MRLPPLNALRAFEAAARHEGYINAAEELHVTRGAISRHVKQLEAHLGVTLFTRQAQGVKLTAAGRRLLPVLSESFANIAQEVTRITADAAELRVLCPPATSFRWLIPRLEGFQRRHPDIRVRLTTDFHADAGLAQDYDIGFSVEHWPGRAEDFEALPLIPVHLVPACAPALLETGPGLSSPEDLAQAVLLHETPRHLDWTAWIEAFDVPGVDPSTGHDFPNLDMAVKAAVMGTGIVMADLVFCQDELASGALVTPFPDMICPSPYGAICLLGKRDVWDTPKVAAFKTWAAEVAREDCRALGL
ncbi:LysR substrate-binding domain-containing protein [Roseovarius sp. 2305UL8-3]|uniref:LysR substrate-binding domain-containing protein n=1 Tax=Roseovarius conchicola TaxID=3121636 RepID=UPI0035285E4D